MFILVLHSLMFVYLAKSVTIVSHGQIADDETRWLLVLEALHSRNDSQYDWCRPHAVIIAWGTTSNLYIDPAAQLVVSCGDRHCYLARNYWDSNSRQKIDNEYAMCTLSAPRWKPVIFDTRRLLFYYQQKLHCCCSWRCQIKSLAPGMTRSLYRRDAVPSTNLVELYSFTKY